MYEELKSWLEQKPSTELVGRRNDPNRCVLSNFLTERYGKRVTIRKSAATIPGQGRLELPGWAVQVYNWLDSSCDMRRVSYTAATALKGLTLHAPIAQLDRATDF